MRDIITDADMRDLMQAWRSSPEFAKVKKKQADETAKTYSAAVTAILDTETNWVDQRDALRDAMKTAQTELLDAMKMVEEKKRTFNIAKLNYDNAFNRLTDLERRPHWRLIHETVGEKVDKFIRELNELQRTNFDAVDTTDQKTDRIWTKALRAVYRRRTNREAVEARLHAIVEARHAARHLLDGLPVHDVDAELERIRQTIPDVNKYTEVLV